MDTRFGTNGSVLTSFGTGSIQAVAVAIQADGKIVVVGTLTNAEFVQEIGLARYNKDGSLDRYLRHRRRGLHRLRRRYVGHRRGRGRRSERPDRGGGDGLGLR